MAGICVIISAGFDVTRTGPSSFIVIGGKRPSVNPPPNIPSLPDQSM